MAKIRLTTRCAGPDGNWAPGSIVVVADEIAEQMVSGGFATHVDPPATGAPVELATLPPAETAVSSRGKKR